MSRWSGIVLACFVGCAHQEPLPALGPLPSRPSVPVMAVPPSPAEKTQVFSHPEVVERRLEASARLPVHRLSQKSLPRPCMVLPHNLLAFERTLTRGNRVLCAGVTYVMPQGCVAKISWQHNAGFTVSFDTEKYGSSWPIVVEGAPRLLRLGAECPKDE